MHPRRKQRLITLILVMSGLAISAAFILYALTQNINLYLTPSEITVEHQQLKAMRLGGMVRKGTVHHGKQTLLVDFMVTDFKRDVKVHFDGVLPALFKGGQGVVVEGHLNSKGEVIATRVLAKHDENYMPPKIKVPHDT